MSTIHHQITFRISKPVPGQPISINISPSSVDTVFSLGSPGFASTGISIDNQGNELPIMEFIVSTMTIDLTLGSNADTNSNVAINVHLETTQGTGTVEMDAISGPGVVITASVDGGAEQTFGPSTTQINLL